MNSDVLDTIEYALNVTLQNYRDGLIIEYPPKIRDRVDAALAEVARLQEADGDLREGLARYAHEAWSGWMKYLFSKCETRITYFSSEEVKTIPAWAVERWSRQMLTPYADLPEQEKESDRQEADRMIAIMRLRETGPQWEPVSDGYSYSAVTFGGRHTERLFFGDGWLTVAWRPESGDEYKASIELPDDMRLCRRTQAEEV